MKGYLTTCDGAQFELPTLLKWEFSYTGSVPCDSFTLRCAYEPAMAETLRRAVTLLDKSQGTHLAEALERELEKRESSGGKAAVRRSSDAVTRQRQATRQAVRPR